MAFIKFLLLLFPIQLMAAEAIVRVLEAPLFLEPDPTSRVVDYRRKGEKIVIDNYHTQPKLKQDDLLETSLKRLKFYNHQYPDQGVTNELDYIPEDFIKTTDQLGRTAYMLRDHIAILYLDSRELKEKRLKYDPTDYRIEEPLPKGYPIEQPYKIPYEGLLTLGYVNRNDRAYQYTENITKSSVSRGYSFAAVWSKKRQKEKPLFTGYQLHFKFSESQYELTSRTAKEKEVRVGLGLYGHWTFFEKDKHRLALTGGARFNLWDGIRVEQKEKVTALEETRHFKGPSLSAHAGFFYSKRAFLGSHISAVIGYDFTPTLPLLQRTKQNPNNSSWWRGGAGEKLGFNLLLEQSLYVGLIFLE